MDGKDVRMLRGGIRWACWSWSMQGWGLRVIPGVQEGWTSGPASHRWGSRDSDSLHDRLRPEGQPAESLWVYIPTQFFLLTNNMVFENSSWQTRSSMHAVVSAGPWGQPWWGAVCNSCAPSISLVPSFLQGGILPESEGKRHPLYFIHSFSLPWP